MSIGMKEILTKVLLEDKSILSRREELTERLKRDLPGNLVRDCTSIEKAMKRCNIGEWFLSADSKGEAERKNTKERAFNALLESGMLSSRAKFVVETFASALEWDKIPSPAKEAPVAEPSVSAEEWICACGQSNSGKYCSACGQKRPTASFQKNLNAEKRDQSLDRLVQDLEKSAPAQTTALPVPAQVVQREPLPQAPYEVPAPTPLTESNTSAFEREKWRQRGEKAKEEYFTWVGRLNRMAYLIKQIKLALWVFLFALIASAISLILPPVGSVLLFCITVIGGIGGWMLSIRRLHDLNKSGWFSLLLLIPYIGVLFAIYMLFFKGTDGPNQYGEDPLQTF